MRLWDALLLPQRVTTRVTDDLRRLADAGASVGALAWEVRGRLPGATRFAGEIVEILDSARDQLVGLRASLAPMSEDLNAVRDAFSATSTQLERLREGVVPELTGVHDAADGLHDEVRRQRELIDALTAEITEMGGQLSRELAALRLTLRPLIQDAGEIREVVEPLESAAERIGHLAERLPGPGRKLLTHGRRDTPPG